MSILCHSLLHRSTNIYLDHKCDLTFSRSLRSLGYRALNGARGRVYATPRVLRHSSCARTSGNSLRSWDAHFVCWVARFARFNEWAIQYWYSFTPRTCAYAPSTTIRSLASLAAGTQFATLTPPTLMLTRSCVARS